MESGTVNYLTTRIHEKLWEELFCQMQYVKIAVIRSKIAVVHAHIAVRPHTAAAA
jgi:tryptophan-rich sensory protein